MALALLAFYALAWLVALWRLRLAHRLLRELRAGCAEPVGTGRLQRALAAADEYLS